MRAWYLLHAKYVLTVSILLLKKLRVGKARGSPRVTGLVVCGLWWHLSLRSSHCQDVSVTPPPPGFLDPSLDCQCSFSCCRGDFLFTIILPSSPQALALPEVAVLDATLPRRMRPGSVPFILFQVSLEVPCVPSTAVSGILLGTQETAIRHSTGVGWGFRQQTVQQTADGTT